MCCTSISFNSNVKNQITDTMYNRPYLSSCNTQTQWFLESLSLQEETGTKKRHISFRKILGLGSSKLACKTTFFWCFVKYFASQNLLSFCYDCKINCVAWYWLTFSQSNPCFWFLDQQPQLSQPFYVILINYGLQRHLVDEFELILWHLRDDMIQINVVLQASFNEPSPKIFLKEMCLFWFQSPPGD